MDPIDSAFESACAEGDAEVSVFETVIEDVTNERLRAIELAFSGDTNEFDKGNSRNDWIAYINAYTGRAAEKVLRNEREGQEFRANMLKAAGLCIAAIEAHDKGWC